MGSGRTRFATTLVAAAVVLAPGAARAQKPSPAAAPATDPGGKARAAELFGKSADAYRSGDFKTAAQLLEEAYALDPQPVLLYNLARAHEGLGDLDAAIATYEQFLEKEPNARDRGAIEQRLATLRRQRDERAALLAQQNAQQKAQQQPAPAAPEPAPRRSLLPYVVGGVGAAALAGGAVLGLMATSANDDAQTEPVHQRALDQRDSAEGLATASTVAFVAGGVLLAAGVAWWVVDGASAKRTGATALRVGLAPGGLALQGGFP